MKKAIIISTTLFFSLIVGVFILVPQASADTTEAVPYQVINLEPSWNIVSTPRVLLGHEFSMPETSDNLAIYLLDPSSPSGWRTMQEVGQTEFQPLFAYFIYNKTTQTQTLKLKYNFNLSPAQRLFQRTLTTGWNAIGIASPDYAIKQGASGGDTNNPSRILNSIIGSISQAVDFTADQPDLDSVKIGDTWASKVASEVNSLRDFRELKGYAVFVTETTDDYHGSQNINDGFEFSVSSDNPTVVNGGSENQTLFNFQIDSLYYDVAINSLIFSHSGTGNKNNITNFKLYDADNGTLLGSIASINEDSKVIFSNLEINISPGIKKIKLAGDISPTATNGETHQSKLENVVLDREVTITGLPISNTLTVNIVAPGSLNITVAPDTPPSQNFVPGSTAKAFTKIRLTAGSGEDISVSSLTLRAYKQIGVDSPISSGDIVNVKIIKSDGTQFGSNVATGASIMSFSGTLTITASSYQTVTVVADIPTTSGTPSCHIDLYAGDVVATGVSIGESIAAIGSAIGNLMTFVRGSLTVSVASTPADQLIFPGTTEVTHLGIVMTAGSAEDIRVTYIKLTRNSSGSGSDDDISNIALYDGATRLTAKKNLTNGYVSFSASDFLNSLGIDIAKSQQKTIAIKADIPSTATIGHQNSLGINNANDIVFVGLSSNTTPDATLTSGPGTCSKINASCSIPSDAYEVALFAGGTLTIQGAADTPDTAIVTVGPTGGVKQDVVFLRVNFTAALEDIDVKSVTIKRIGGRDADFASINLWDGTTQLGASQVLTSGETTFNFPAGSYWRVAIEKTLTIKADLNGINPSGLTTGDNPKLCISANGVTTQGASSGINIIPSGLGSDLCGNEQILRKSKPTVAAASLPSTVYGAGEKVLYRWTITADSKGNIGWKKVVFDMSGSVTYSTAHTVGCEASNCSQTDGVYMSTSTDVSTVQLIAASSMKLYDLTNNEQITATAWTVMNASGIAKISFVAASEQIVAAGETKTYELRGTILKGGSIGDVLMTKLADRGINIITNTYTNVANTEATLVWTDKSAISHSETTIDWTNDYKVPGLPTATLSLSK